MTVSVVFTGEGDDDSWLCLLSLQAKEIMIHDCVCCLLQLNEMMMIQDCLLSLQMDEMKMVHDCVFYRSNVEKLMMCLLSSFTCWRNDYDPWLCLLPFKGGGNDVLWSCLLLFTCRTNNDDLRLCPLSFTGRGNGDLWLCLLLFTSGASKWWSMAVSVVVHG